MKPPEQQWPWEMKAPPDHWLKAGNWYFKASHIGLITPDGGDGSIVYVDGTPVEFPSLSPKQVLDIIENRK